jgi:N utilization substance protein B
MEKKNYSLYCHIYLAFFMTSTYIASTNLVGVNLLNKNQNSSNKGTKKARASAARLAAVQAVYQRKLNDKPVSETIEEFINHHSNEKVDGEEMIKPDRDLFSKITKGVAEQETELNNLILKTLETRGADKKIEPLLMAIILCGTYEIKDNFEIDPPIIISDYLNVTHAFYDQGEHGLVNAVLDNVSKEFT